MIALPRCNRVSERNVFNDGECYANFDEFIGGVIARDINVGTNFLDGNVVIELFNVDNNDGNKKFVKAVVLGRRVLVAVVEEISIARMLVNMCKSWGGV